MVINVPLNSSVAANLIFASRFVLNINYHQCPLIFSLILALRKVFKIHQFFPRHFMSNKWHFTRPLHP